MSSSKPTIISSTGRTLHFDKSGRWVSSLLDNVSTVKAKFLGEVPPKGIARLFTLLHTRNAR